MRRRSESVMVEREGRWIGDLEGGTVEYWMLDMDEG